MSFSELFSLVEDQEQEIDAGRIMPKKKAKELRDLLERQGGIKRAPKY